MTDVIAKDTVLFSDISRLIVEARQRTAMQVNSELSLLYWSIGKRIRTEILNNERAEYGEKTIRQLSEQLTLEYGKGWSDKQLRHCLRSAETIQSEEKFYALRSQLTWTHIKSLMYIDDDLKREFYIELCIYEHWSSRQLQERINSLLFERTAISRKPEQTVANDLEILRKTGDITEDLSFRDPYILDFLGLADKYSERDLESAILSELQHFIMEFGQDFAFMARQKRITIDNDDYYIDLLFYHRSLRCLIVIELKIGEFEAAFKGQMELYLRYLEKYEQKAGENPPVGLILCSGKKTEHIELMQLHKSNIKVAEYLTSLPPKELLLKKLHQSIELAKSKFHDEAGQ